MAQPLKHRRLKREPAVPRKAAGSIRTLTGRRLWCFRLGALGLPFVLLVLLELGLRLFGYGYPTAFFSEWTARDGRKYLCNSDTFSSRFFPPGLERWASPFVIPAEKPADVRRIFIFGESAAMGDPEPAYGASRYLEVLLRNRFPGQEFEIVNLGITAVNSHVILPIAKECSTQHGDIWIIYMGNNEMVGPFGAATIFGWRAPPLPIVRSYLAIQRTRVGQLLVAGLRRFNHRNRSQAWGGMRMFLQNQVAPTDSHKETVYRSFATNLRDITGAGLDSGAKVILSTVSVNLRDCPPFASFTNRQLSAEQLEQFQNYYAEGLQAEHGGNCNQALQNFAQAAGLDPHCADVQFHWADGLLALSNASARDHFQLACDNDALPFRADVRINGAIRTLGQTLGGDRLVLCDAEKELQQATSSGAAGDESFFEHVHFNFDGNYRLARAWAESVARLLSSAPTNNWSPQAECEQQLGLSDFNRAYVLQSVLRRLQQPPLSNQPNNPQRIRRIQAEENGTQARLQSAAAVVRARELFQSALARSPDDHYLHEGLANFLESIGDFAGAEAAYRRALELQPQDFYARLRLGCMLSRQGQFPEAISLLTQSVKMRPSQPDAWYELARAQTQSGNYAAALEDFDHADQLRPKDPDIQYYRLLCDGKRLAGSGRHTEAIAEYHAAIGLLPDNWEAHFELGGELDSLNRFDEATAQFATAAQLNPGYSRTHFNYGVLLAKQQRFAEAEREFEATIHLEPGYVTAKDYLAETRRRLNAAHP
jgi:tetratricopeptide (TPR) repeat protein